MIICVKHNVLYIVIWIKQSFNITNLKKKKKIFSNPITFDFWSIASALIKLWLCSAAPSVSVELGWELEPKRTGLTLPRPTIDASKLLNSFANVQEK